MCRIFEVSRSGFYSFVKRRPSDRQIDDEKVKGKLKPLFEKHHKTYGPERMSVLLTKNGIQVGRTRIKRLMAECSLVPVTRPKFTKTTDSSHKLEACPDLVNRHFESDEPNKVFTSDITYIWTMEGYVYLAVILDIYSRYVAGWALGKQQDAALILSAFSMAIKRRKVPKGFIFHSDKGGQFFSKVLKAQLNILGVQQSMGSTGDCFDNAVTESFNATIKKECIYQNQFNNYKEAYSRIFTCIFQDFF